MHALWHWLLYLLTWAAHDPATLNAERARCAGAVNVAYAALAQQPVAPKRAEPVNPAADATPAVQIGPAPKRAPDLPPLPPAAPCPQCSGTGRIYRSDGGYVKCPCQCPTGKCPTRR